MATDLLLNGTFDSSDNWTPTCTPYTYAPPAGTVNFTGGQLVLTSGIVSVTIQEGGVRQNFTCPRTEILRFEIDLKSWIYGGAPDTGAWVLIWRQGGSGPVYEGHYGSAGVKTADFQVQAGDVMTLYIGGRAWQQMNGQPSVLASTWDNAHIWSGALDFTISGVSPTSGVPGATVRVTTQNAPTTGTATITFDGVAATNVTAVDANTFTCRAPTHAAGLVNVALTKNGLTATATGAFTYTTTGGGGGDPASMSIVSITPNHGPMAVTRRVRIVVVRG